MMTEFEINILKNVSCETIKNLKTYQNLLCEWQNKFNLVSNNSLSDAWNRHFLDSAQLANFIRKDANIVCDLGSGAGFPALVLAVIFKEINPKTHFVLIESIKKKALFLNEVINQLDLNAEVINERIEKIDLLKADYITARALASLDDLLQYAVRFYKENTVCLFLKGKTYETELSNALKKWNFTYDTYNNKINEDGVVLEIKKIRRKKT